MVAYWTDYYWTDYYWADYKRLAEAVPPTIPVSFANQQRSIYR
jgi:hypothetical protein